MHKIIALWAHPRSMSTATERIMRERGDLTCLHEPFMHPFYVGQGKDFPGFEPIEGHPTDYKGVLAMLEENAAEKPVFFKDMSYYVVPRMLDDSAALGRITHSFLIRNPLASILSYYKLDQGFARAHVGLETQWQLYQAVKDAGHETTVIEADTVRADPKAIMRAYWDAVRIEYCEAAFDWQAPPKDWEHVSDWHGEAMATSGIRTADAEEMLRKEAEFDALAKEVPHLRDYLNHHMPYYQKLSELALRV